MRRLSRLLNGGAAPIPRSPMGGWAGKGSQGTSFPFAETSSPLCGGGLRWGGGSYSSTFTRTRPVCLDCSGNWRSQPRWSRRDHRAPSFRRPCQRSHGCKPSLRGRHCRHRADGLPDLCQHDGHEFRAVNPVSSVSTAAPGTHAAPADQVLAGPTPHVSRGELAQPSERTRPGTGPLIETDLCQRAARLLALLTLPAAPIPALSRRSRWWRPFKLSVSLPTLCPFPAGSRRIFTANARLHKGL
jgi:hypothetical protein